MITTYQKTDDLAIERTRLANQRTILSFARTFIGFLGGGISAISIDIYEDYKWLGYIFIAASFVTLFFGILNYLKSKQIIRKIQN